MNNKKAREEKALSKELERQRKEQIRIAERERKKQMGGSKDCLQVIFSKIKNQQIDKITYHKLQCNRYKYIATYTQMKYFEWVFK